MKCPICTSGTIEADDLSKVPMTVTMRMYPAPPKIVFAEKVDIGGVTDGLEISVRPDLGPGAAMLRFDVLLPATVTNAMKTDASTIYELAVNLSGIKEI